MLISRGMGGVLLACGLWAASASHAAMQLSRTRVVLLESTGRAVIEAENKDSVPLLMQAWVDQGEDSDAAAPPALPLIVDPPVVRLEPGQSRALQIVLTEVPEGLPTDRESLFWLNVLEVPLIEESIAREDKRLLMSVQSRLKVFYRPRALADVAAVDDSTRLRFRLAREGKHLWLEIHNPASVHQTLAAINFSPTVEGATPQSWDDAPMLAPFATARIDLPAVLSAEPERWKVDFSTLDDDGNVIEHVQAL